MDAFWNFMDQVYSAPSLVWTVAFFMSALAGWILHNYLEDMLQTVVISIVMFCAILVANAGFVQMGVYFSDDKEANIVWAAGASMCSITLLAVILMRIFYVVGDFHRWFKGPPQARPIP